MKTVNEVWCLMFNTHEEEGERKTERWGERESGSKRDKKNKNT